LPISIARSSSVAYSGLPPLATQTALCSCVALAGSSTVARASSLTALSLNNAGRTIDDAFVRNATSDALVAAGSLARSATNTESPVPSSRAAR